MELLVLFAGDDAIRCQRGIPSRLRSRVRRLGNISLIVCLGLGERSFTSCQLRLGLLHRLLERTGIDLEQHLAFANVLAFFECNSRDRPGDL